MLVTLTPQCYIVNTTMAKVKQFQMRVSEDFNPKVDALRKAEKDLPSRSEMVKRLVDRAYEKVKKR